MSRRLALAGLLSLIVAMPARADFTDEFPELKRHVFLEPRSPIRFGFGSGLLGILPNKALHTINIFQIHYVHSFLDIEMLSASLGLSSFAKESFAGSRHFMLRFVPKVRPFDFLSFGPLVGFEYVSFPNVEAVLTKDGFVTPKESFSSQGLIYGGVVSQTFALDEHYSVKINQVGFLQTYRTDRASNGWAFQFSNPELAADPEKTSIKAAFVVLLELSLIF